MTDHNVADVADDWSQRRITLVGDLVRIHEVCEEWKQHGWRVLDVQNAGQTVGGNECHTVTAAVPPSNLEPTQTA